MIEFRGVSKRHGELWAIRDVTLEIAKGELVAIVGESGSGKTTLLKTVNRLHAVDAGVVIVDGRDVAREDPVALRRSIGYVIQQVGLMPHLTVGDNIAMVPRLLGWSRDQIRARTDELLVRVGLPPETYRERFPEQLSGGQRQRVGVARALAARPNIVLLDEPFGALDPITRTALHAELREIHEDLGLTQLMVTHDLVEALTLADRIAVMLRGELVQVATPKQLMASPAHAYVEQLVAMARVHGEQLRQVGAP